MHIPSAYAVENSTYLPTDAQIAAGTVTIQQAGQTMQVIIASDKEILNWQEFSIAQGESVNFQQPGTDSVLLIRVLGSAPTSILGQITANGKVLLLNPSGVVYGSTAQDTLNGGLVISTLNMTNADFMAGNYTFINDGSAEQILIQGTLSTAGYLALIAPQIVNEGSIVTDGPGAIVLGAGDKVTLTMQGDTLASMTVDQNNADAFITNNGVINADGGRIVLTAGNSGDQNRTIINIGGSIITNGVDGAIQLNAIGGDVTINAMLDSSFIGITAGDSITINATSGILFDGGINATTANLFINADTSNLGSDLNVISNTGAITGVNMGTITLNSGATTGASNWGSNSGVVLNTDAITGANVGTITLSGSTTGTSNLSSYSGVVPNTGAITVGNGATLISSGSSTGISNLSSYSGVVPNTGAITVGNGGTITSSVYTTGTSNLSSNSDFISSTGAGAITLVNPGTSTLTDPITLANAGTLTLSGYTTGTSNLGSYGNVISNVGGVAVANAGTLALNGSTTASPAIATALTPGAMTMITSSGSILTSSIMLLGDTNGNGKVDISDALLALRIALGLDNPTDIQKFSADMAPRVNGTCQPDGKIDIADAIMILQQVMTAPKSDQAGLL